MIVQKDVPLFEKIFLGARVKRSDATEELDFVKKNGTTLSVILSIVQVTSEDDNRPETLFATIDNSECKNALRKIRILNQELEAFTYSVSHDLRAPLRSIDGYSKILQEDYGQKLEDEGKRVLTVIMNNAKRMGKLIDDLLDYASLGRNDPQPSRLNMTAMVNNIVHELRAVEPGRQIDVKVDELHPVFADAGMMRQVWIHLIDNAFKYSGKKEHAVIEISSHLGSSGEIAFRVKDNGVGFDMKYAPKLFGVFQRLHKIQDFSGTGVGLAIVKRIITRHEGRVWAEGSLQEGATFYFTIPNDNESA